MWATSREKPSLFEFTPIPQNWLKADERPRNRFAPSAHVAGHQLCVGCHTSYRWGPVATVLLPSSELCIDLWKPASDPKHSPRTLFTYSTHSLWGPSLSPMMSHTNSVLMTWLLNLFPQMSSRPAFSSIASSISHQHSPTYITATTVYSQTWAPCKCCI